MVAGAQGHRIDGYLKLARALRFARADHHLGHGWFTKMLGPEAARSRDKAFGLSERSDHGDFFLIAGTLGKHAQLEQRALPMGEVDHHVSVVQDVGRPVRIAFSQVVVRHRG